MSYCTQCPEHDQKLTSSFFLLEVTVLFKKKEKKKKSPSSEKQSYTHTLQTGPICVCSPEIKAHTLKCAQTQKEMDLC